jgi:hypothetical protein
MMKSARISHSPVYKAVNAVNEADIMNIRKLSALSTWEELESPDAAI